VQNGLKRLAWVLIVVIVLALPAEHTAGATRATVADQVLHAVDANGWADIMVLLRTQADSSAAAGGTGARMAKSRAVFEALRSTAQASQPALAQVFSSRGIAYQPFWIVNAIAVRASAALVQELAARSDVAAIVSNAPFYVPLEEPEPSTAAIQAGNSVGWNLSWVKAPEMWAMGITGQGIVYANADTGVQWDHPALMGQYRGWNGSSVVHDYNWWDGVRDAIPGVPDQACGVASRAPCDDHGHGTHTTGIGVGTSISGQQIGVASGAKWIGCRNMLAGVGRPSTYLSCYQFFMAPTDLDGNNPDPSKHPDVVGNSYACPPSELCMDLHVFESALQNMRAAGIFMSVSAGNSGPGCSTVQDPPALEASVFTVGSTTSGNILSDFSSRGPVTVDGSGRLKPDLVAPGQPVFSAYIGSSYATMSGTSMASPHVAGAVALLWSALPELRGDVAKTEAILRLSAVHLLPKGTMCGSDTPTSVPNNQFGYGELDILAAFQSQLSRLYLPIGMFK
jgi:serine protease AprX